MILQKCDFRDESKFSSFTGCSIIHPHSYITRFSLPTSNSILFAELYAIYLAIKSAVQSSNNNVCIFSVSLPTIPNFRNTTHTIPQLILHTLTRRPSLKVALIWIPANSNIPVNEVADKAAKESAVMLPHPLIPTFPSDITPIFQI